MLALLVTTFTSSPRPNRRSVVKLFTRSACESFHKGTGGLELEHAPTLPPSVGLEPFGSVWVRCARAPTANANGALWPFVLYRRIGQRTLTGGLCVLCAGSVLDPACVVHGLEPLSVVCALWCVFPFVRPSAKGCPLGATVRGLTGATQRPKRLGLRALCWCAQFEVTKTIQRESSQTRGERSNAALTHA